MKKATLGISSFILMAILSNGSFAQEKRMNNNSSSKQQNQWPYMNQDTTWGYYGDYNSFRNFNDSLLQNYNEQINYRRRWMEDPVERSRYTRQLDSMSRQGTALRQRLSGYRQSDTTNWNNFQRSFNQDLRRMDSSLQYWPNHSRQHQMQMRRDSL